MFCSKGPLLRFSRLSREFRKTKLKPCTNRLNDHNDLFAIRHNGGTTVSRRIPIPLSGRHKYIEAHRVRVLMVIISHVDETRGMYSICRRFVKKKYGENVHTTDSVKWYWKSIALAGCLIVWILSGWEERVDYQNVHEDRRRGPRRFESDVRLSHYPILQLRAREKYDTMFRQKEMQIYSANHLLLMFTMAPFEHWRWVIIVEGREQCSRRWLV